MTFNKTLLLVLALGFVLLANPAFAQTSLVVKMSVPYSFHAGILQFSPGTYVISCDTGSNIVWFYNTGNRETRAVMALVPITDRRTAKSQATFHVYGDKYYLASIWNGLRHSGREMAPSKAEKESAKAAPYTVARLELERM